MNNYENLLKAEDNWVTDLGAFFPGERVVYRGHNLLSDFNDDTWIGLLVFGVTGRKLRKEQLLLLEKIWMLSISYPDPRLWNNRISALAGTVRTTPALGVSASIAITEATIYGFRAMIKAFDFIIRAKCKMDKGESLKQIIQCELKENRSIGGYGRPLTTKDERIDPVFNIASELGLENGLHTQLAYDIATFLIEGRWRFQMNIAGLTAALTADQGISLEEYSHIMIPSFLAGSIPCYADALSHPEGTFFPLRCEIISYVGSNQHRSW